MKYYKYRFIFESPVSCYDDLISEDTVIAKDLDSALTILKKGHVHAKVRKVYCSEIELFKRLPATNKVNIYSGQSVLHTGKLLNEDVD